MLELNNVEISYDKFVAVKELSMTIKMGEFFTFLGPSGCGKTTTLRAIAGFTHPTQGNIMFDGMNMTAIEPEHRRFGFVFQNYALFPHMTVFENVAFGLKVRKLSKAVIEEKVDHYLEMLELTAHKYKNVAMLSGGQQQRVSIARALVLEPKVLLMDEPLSNLDAKLRVTMRNEIKRIQRKLGITTIYVTHDQEEALAVSDRIAVFHQGAVQQIGTPEEIYEKPANAFVYTFVGQSNRLLTSELSSNAVLAQEFDPAKNQQLFFRPEHVRLDRVQTGQAGEVTIPIEIIDMEYNGRIIIYSCKFNEHLFEAVMMNQYGHQDFLTGEQVYAHINREAMELYAV